MYFFFFNPELNPPALCKWFTLLTLPCLIILKQDWLKQYLPFFGKPIIICYNISRGNWKEDMGLVWILCPCLSFPFQLPDSSEFYISVTCYALKQYWKQLQMPSQLKEPPLDAPGLLVTDSKDNERAGSVTAQVFNSVSDLSHSKIPVPCHPWTFISTWWHFSCEPVQPPPSLPPLAHPSTSCCL